MTAENVATDVAVENSVVKEGDNVVGSPGGASNLQIDEDKGAENIVSSSRINDEEGWTEVKRIRSPSPFGSDDSPVSLITFKESQKNGWSGLKKLQAIKLSSSQRKKWKKATALGNSSPQLS